MEFNEITSIIRLLKKKYNYKSRHKFQYRINKIYNYQNKLIEDEIIPPKRFIQIHKQCLDNLHLLFTIYYKLSIKSNLPNKDIQLSWNLHNFIQECLANIIHYCVIGIELDKILSLKSILSNITEASKKFKTPDKKEILALIRIISKQLDNSVEMWKEN
jgi:hypothetical protein